MLDAGALIAVERGSGPMQALIRRADATGTQLLTPAPVLAQVWRNGARQVLLARFLGLPFVTVDLLTRTMWLAAGVLCGRTATSDVVDAAVVVCARERGARYVVTADLADLRRLDATLLLREP